MEELTVSHRSYSILAGLVFVAAFVPYIRAILRKETKPTKSTWIIWATLDTITFTGMWAEHAVNGQIIGAVFGAWTVAALSFRYGVPGWSKTDIQCLAGAALGLLLWKLFNSPTLGMLTTLIVVFLGSIPTFKSAMEDPSRENKTAWAIYWFSCVCALLAVPQWNIANALQPITFFVIESVMIYILFLRRQPIASAV
jgi:hypothetical protein